MGKLWDLNMEHGLDNSIASVLNFLISIAVLRLYKRIFLFLGNAHWSTVSENKWYTHICIYERENDKERMIK